MKITSETIDHIAKLAKLKLAQHEKEIFQSDLKDVLDAFSKLSKLSTDNVPSSFHPIKLKNIMREDIPHKCLSEEEVFQNTTHKSGGYFKGPKIV